MSYERIMLIVIGVLILLNIVVLMSGCALVERVGEALFETKPKENPIETPKDKLWSTVKKSNWLVTLAIPIIALGAVAMFNGAAKLGMSAIIFGSVNLFMALATSRFAFWMALFGLVGSCAAVAASILAKNKALKEIVFGVQKVKEEAIPDLYKPRAKELLAKQTKSTKKIVSKIKTKAKLRGEL